MKHDSENEKTVFEERTRAMFEASLDTLDGRTRSRLNQARQAALSELRARRAHPWRNAWMPLSGVAAAAVLAVWMTLGQGTKTNSLDNAMPVEDFEIFADAPNLDLLQDVEFYAWVAEETANASNENTG